MKKAWILVLHVNPSGQCEGTMNVRVFISENAATEFVRKTCSQSSARWYTIEEVDFDDEAS